MRKITAALLALVIAGTSWSCGHDVLPEEPIQGDAAVTPSAADFEDDPSYYTGVFNEEIFEHIVQNISFKGTRLSLPGTFKELGREFSLGDPIVFKNKGFATYNLYCSGVKVGRTSFDSDHELSDKELGTLEINSIFLSPDAGCEDGVFLAGAELNSDYKVLEELLGQPTESEMEDGEGLYKYAISEEKYVQFNILNSKIINAFINA